jgi:hypothetical protein
MVALAAFLAELRVAEDVCGIVFDDPVSSLDHRHRHAVARRIVREAANRQVIVFTHDLFFLLLLRLAAKDASHHAVHYQHIFRGAVGERRPGIITADLPVGLQDTKHAIRMMKHRLARMAADVGGSEAAWIEQAEGLCDQLSASGNWPCWTVKTLKKRLTAMAGALVICMPKRSLARAQRQPQKTSREGSASSWLGLNGSKISRKRLSQVDKRLAVNEWCCTYRSPSATSR